MYILLLLPIICGSFGRSADCWVLLQVPLQSDVRSQEQVPVEEEYPQVVEEPVVETKGKKGKKKERAVPVAAEPQAAPVAAVTEVREAPKKKEVKEPKAKKPAALGKNKFAAFALLGEDEDSIEGLPPPSFTVRGGLSTEGIKGSVPRAEVVTQPCQAGPPVLPDEPMDLAKAHAMALRSLERLAARREMNAKEGEAGDQTCESGHSPTRVEAVVEEAAAPSIRSSDQLDAFPGAQRAAGAEGEAEGSVGRWEGLEAQEKPGQGLFSLLSLSGDGLLGGLDILTTPVAPLQTFSLGHSGHSGHGSARGPPRDPLRHISDDARDWSCVL
eukprot:g29473.t1